MNLYECLKEYKALTLDIMEEIQREAKVDSLIIERDNILKLINELECDEQEIKALGNSFGLLELDLELEHMCKREKVNVRKKMQKIKVGKQINNNYNNIDIRSRIFNKTI